MPENKNLSGVVEFQLRLAPFVLSCPGRTARDFVFDVAAWVAHPAVYAGGWHNLTDLGVHPRCLELLSVLSSLKGPLMHLKSVTVTLHLILLFFLPLLPLQQPQQQQPPPPIPPALDRLKIFLGTFDVTEHYEKTSLFPKGGESHGQYKSHAGPANFSYISDFWTSGGPEGSIAGEQVITWDTDSAGLKRYTFGSNFPGAFISPGDWQENSLVFGGDFEFNNQKLHFTDSTTLGSSPDLFSM